MLRRHGTLPSIKVRRSDQSLRLKVGENSVEFVRRAHGIEGCANRDCRSRDKTEGCLRPVRQEKRYAILPANADGTERVGVLPDLSVQPRIGQGHATRRQQGECGRIMVGVISDQPAHSNDDRPSLSGPGGMLVESLR